MKVRARAPLRLGLAAVFDSQKRLIGIVTGEEIIKRLVQVGAF